MGLITHSTDSMVGGVSQQPPTRRFASQAEVQENALGTIIEGLRKRPPTEHVGELAAAFTGAVAYHTINRDATERYVVAAQDKRLKVYDLADGSVNTVYDIGGDVATFGAGGDFDYLATSDPVNDLEFLTIADATIIVNKAIQPKMDAATTTDRGFEALAFVKQGNYSTKYTLTVDTRTATVETGDSADVANEPGIRTDFIAEKLVDALTTGSATNTNGVTVSTSGDVLDANDYDVQREGSTIWIKRDNGADFDISSDDSVASSVLAVIKDSVQTFSVLPTVAPNGFTIKIDGVPDQGTVGATAYYVQFETTDTDATAFGDGVWEEAVAGGIEFKPNYAFMPHLLVRLSNGDFLFTQVSGTALGGSIGSTAPYTAPKWGEVAAGDLDSNPLPVFMDTSSGSEADAIRGIAFHKDRLVIMAGETVVMSEVGQYFNFFRTTVTTLLDSARISVAASSTRVNLLNYAVPLRGNLVLFSSAAQFLLQGGQDGTITPTNVSIAEVSAFESTEGVLPALSEQSIFAVGTRGANTQVRELYDASSNRPSLDAVDITGQVPSYIVGATEQMVASPTEDCLVLRAAASDTLYIYKWFINGGERAQSAWSKFIIGGTGVEVLNVDWVDQYLYLVTRRGSETCLERMDFEPFLTDTGETYRVHLDRRVTEGSTGVSSSYDAGTNATTFTLPYDLGTGVTMQVVTRTSGGTLGGQNLPVTATGADTVTVSGDKTSTPVYIGEQYTLKYEFSELHLQRGKNSYSAEPITAASHRVRYGRLNYGETAFFSVKVTAKGGTPDTYVFNGNLLNEPETQLGAIGLYDGHFQFPVMADHDRVTIELENDSPLPSRFLSCEWESFYHSRVGMRSRF